MSNEKFTPQQEEHPAEQEPRSAIESLPASIQVQLRDGVVTPDLIQRIDPSLHAEVARLLSETRPAALAVNLGSFDGLDQSIAMRIIHRGYAKDVLEHLDHFIITDHNVLIATLLNNTSARDILKHRDRLKLTDTELAEAFINIRMPYTVFNFIRFLPNIDFERITELLYRDGRLAFMAENLGILRDINQDDLAQRMLESRGVFLDHISNFDNLNRETAVMALAQSSDAIKHLGRFTGLDTPFAQTCINNNPFPGNPIAYRLDRFANFEPSRMTDWEQRSMGDMNAVIALSKSGNFRALALLLSCFKPHNIEAKAYFQPSETLDSLERAGDFGTARDLLDCYDALDIPYRPDHGDAIRAHAAREDERRAESEPARERYADGIRVTQEITRFYLDQFMRADLKRKLYEPRTVGGVEFTETLEYGSFKNNVTYDSLQRSIENNTRRVFEWIRQYLVTAVHSELKHQEDLEQPVTDVVLPPRFKNLHDFLTRGTEEELRRYCSMAEKRFEEEGWYQNIGGEAWARIARLAREMWGDVHPRHMSAFVDRAFQIEHNTGMVFDKDPRALAFSPQREKDMLDAKFEARTIDDLLKEMDALITDSAFKESMHERVRAYQELMQAPVREIGGE